jgi:hypothetical protein
MFCSFANNIGLLNFQLINEYLISNGAHYVCAQSLAFVDFAYSSKYCANVDEFPHHVPARQPYAVWPLELLDHIPDSDMVYLMMSR